MNGLFYTILFLKKLNHVAFYLCEALHGIVSPASPGAPLGSSVLRFRRVCFAPAFGFYLQATA